MKKAILLIVGIVGLFFGIESVDAGVKINLTAEGCTPATITYGEVQTCTVYGETSDEVERFTATIKPSDANLVTVRNVTAAAGWSGSVTTSNVDITSTTGNKTGKFAIFTYQISLTNNWKEGDHCNILISAIVYPPTPPVVCDPKVECCPGDTYETNPLCPKPPVVCDPTEECCPGDTYETNPLCPKPPVVCDPTEECCEGDTYETNPLCPKPPVVCDPTKECCEGDTYETNTHCPKPVVCDSKVTCCPGDTPQTNHLCVTNPDTGSFVPYVLIGGGLISAIGIYLFARSRNRIYKI